MHLYTIMYKPMHKENGYILFYNINIIPLKRFVSIYIMYNSIYFKEVYLSEYSYIYVRYAISYYRVYISKLTLQTTHYNIKY